MLPDRPMSDLTAAYDRLARGWTHEQLADRYRDAKRRGEQLPECDQDHLIRRPIAMLASAVPACASLSVAIHVIHVLPATGALALRDQLLRNAENNSAVALYRCHQALELDGQAHDYSADAVAAGRLRHRRAAPRDGTPEPRAAVARRAGPGGSSLAVARDRRPRRRLARRRGSHRGRTRARTRAARLR